MDAWLAATNERRRKLDGKARSVSSSHSWTGGELSAGRVRIAIDLLAMVSPAADGKPKIMKEYRSAGCFRCAG
jgi:hypothetical protein